MIYKINLPKNTAALESPSGHTDHGIVHTCVLLPQHTLQAKRVKVKQNYKCIYPYFVWADSISGENQSALKNKSNKG